MLLYLRGSAPSQNLETGSAELWALPLGGQAFPVVRAAGGAGQGQFSPSGKWIAFRATESRRPEVYIQRFPDGDKISVSTSGGVQPRWRSDGKELYYLGPDNRLMTVAVDVEGQTPVIGAPTPLFAQHWSFVPQGNSIQNYSVSRDGQRFLVDVYEEARVPVTVLLNWTPAN